MNFPAKKSKAQYDAFTRIYEHHRSMHYYVLQYQHNIYHASTSELSDQHGYLWLVFTVIKE